VDALNVRLLAPVWWNTRPALCVGNFIGSMLMSMPMCHEQIPVRREDELLSVQVTMLKLAHRQ
jgi:hypothetical protein